MYLNIIMKSVVKKFILIFLLFITIVLVTNIIRINKLRKAHNMVVISNNYVDASFSSDQYHTHIDKKNQNNNSLSNIFTLEGRNINLNKFNVNIDNVNRYRYHSINIVSENNDENNIIRNNKDINNRKKNNNRFLEHETDFYINKPFSEGFTSKVVFDKLNKNENNNSPPKFIGKIDKILFINLKHRKDRKKQIYNEFSKMNFPNEKIERIDAVLEKYNGHIGCCKSHIKAMKIIIKNNYKYTLVFEDDFVFTISQSELDNKINKFFKEYKDDWDIIQLASHYTSLKDDRVEYIKKVNRASTSSAYLINRKFAEKLLKDLQDSLKLMEEEMIKFNNSNNNKLKKKFETNYALDQHWYNLQKNSKWYLFKPYIGKQGGSAVSSSIMSSKLEGFTSNISHNVKIHTLLC